MKIHPQYKEEEDENGEWIPTDKLDSANILANLDELKLIRDFLDDAIKDLEQMKKDGDLPERKHGWHLHMGDHGDEYETMCQEQEIIICYEP